MPARRPIAFFYSVLLHASAVAAIAALAFAFHQNTPPQTQVFELVAGPPTDLTATEAPALGNPDGSMDVTVPEPRAPRPAPPEPPAPVPEPAPAVLPETPVAPPREAPVRKEETPRRAPRAEAKAAAERARAESRMSYQDFVKRYGTPKNERTGRTGGTSRPIAVPKVGRGIANGVWGGSVRSTGGGGGNAMTAAEHSAMEAYFARLVMVLKQNHEKPPGLSDLLNADVSFYLAADGTLSRVRIERSSGNASFDDSCLEAFRRVGSIGPTPNGKSDTYVITFQMKDQ